MGWKCLGPAPRDVVRLSYDPNMVHHSTTLANVCKWICSWDKWGSSEELTNNCQLKLKNILRYPSQICARAMFFLRWVWSIANWNWKRYYGIPCKFVHRAMFLLANVCRWIYSWDRWESSEKLTNNCQQTIANKQLPTEIEKHTTVPLANLRIEQCFSYSEFRSIANWNWKRYYGILCKFKHRAIVSSLLVRWSRVVCCLVTLLSLPPSFLFISPLFTHRAIVSSLLVRWSRVACCLVTLLSLPPSFLFIFPLLLLR